MLVRIFVITAGAIGTLLAWPGMAQAQSVQQWPWIPQGPCSDQTIKGTWLFTVHGEALSSPNTPPITTTLIDGVGTITFDGKGNLTQQDFIVRNSVPPTNSTTNGFTPGETGTYTVYADCTGKAEILLGSPSNTRTLALVVSPAAGTIHAVVSAATVGGSTAYLQVHSDFEKISNSVP